VGTSSKTRPQPIATSGLIAGIEGRFLLLTQRGNDVEDLKLRIERATQILLDGRPATLDDLQPGDQASVLYLPDGTGGVALRVLAKSLGRVEGTLTAVDEATHRVKITTAAGKVVPLIFDERTRIVVHRRPARPAALAGMTGEPCGALFERESNALRARLIVVIDTAAIQPEHGP
jgi:hypothetical protein